jgi:copper chaperone CopZ
MSVTTDVVEMACEGCESTVEGDVAVDELVAVVDDAGRPVSA